MGVSSQGVSNISTDTNYTPAGARGAGISVSSPIGTTAIYGRAAHRLCRLYLRRWKSRLKCSLTRSICDIWVSLPVSEKSQRPTETE
ncbi:hypothetical protein XENTR_v10015562 [Xenopus tropicalis]|nr:hypothetical protein XENTR_v10015562 [Xenopus tropicalis]